MITACSHRTTIMISKLKAAGLSLAMAFAVAAPAVADPTHTAPAAKHPRDYIFAVNHGGIRSWRPDGRDGLLVEGRRGEWYRATFFGYCDDLRFHTHIGFVASPGDRLDKWSAIKVDGMKCQFKSFEPVAAPVAKKT